MVKICPESKKKRKKEELKQDLEANSFYTKDHIEHFRMGSTRRQGRWENDSGVG